MDEEGIQTIQIMAKNMIFLLKAIDSAKKELPIKEPKIWTNFIR